MVLLSQSPLQNNLANGDENTRFIFYFLRGLVAPRAGCTVQCGTDQFHDGTGHFWFKAAIWTEKKKSKLLLDHWLTDYTILHIHIELLVPAKGLGL
jgi:hypothetical protein